MKNLLIVTKSQYGYHIDPYKFGYYLKNDFQITHLSWDFGLPKITVPGVQTKYLTREGSKAMRFFQFLKQINKEIKTGNYDLVFLVYFPGCSFLLRENPQQIFNLDIRTATDTDSSLINFCKDKLLKWESSRFPRLSILSHGLAKKLGFKKYHFLPLGGERFCTINKSFDQANLLYVGTLENRNLLVFIRGFHKFLKSLDTAYPSISLTIVGDGPGNERSEIENYIQSNHLEKVIKTTGYVHNDLLHDYFEKANVGVSFVPITPYYTHQPPTKTYEYLLSGLPVLATATEENAKIISDDCGVLVQDSEEAVTSGLTKLMQRLKEFDSEKIRQACSENSWQNISKNNLRPYLESLMFTNQMSFQIG
ncbi:glycosyltransferase [Cyclobacterium jeungdonense]|uniref:Glycosyltransferase n=1 Tax=Cyclobacterium jeungdonense TaxID=708087 RepID=A0ABT8C2J1_9BACT|nr:glycosyltransferase [Cyclobacterium jeungdonense]MDN3686556.1 glycosyltransferase [Cyclobacterium jeungdonense]